MNRDEQTPMGGEPEALLALANPNGPDAMAINAMLKARAAAAPAVDPKRVTTAQARAALVGAVLTPSHDDHGRPSWLLSRWTLTREFTSLDDLERVLDMMRAPR